MHELEQLVVRCQRKGKLRTCVVCPGVLYGQGEGNDGLHPIMRAAWEVGVTVVWGAAKASICHARVAGLQDGISTKGSAPLPPQPLHLSSVHPLAATAPSPSHLVCLSAAAAVRAPHRVWLRRQPRAHGGSQQGGGVSKGSRV